MAPYPFAYFINQVVPIEKATVSIAANSLQYGTTCFGGIKGVFRKGKRAIFRLKDHHERLMNASQILGMGFSIDFSAFEGIIRELVHKNQPEEDFYIRPFIFSPEERLSPKPQGLPFHLAIYFMPLSNYFGKEGGKRLTISCWHKFSDAALPTKAKAGGCYVNSFMATGDAVRKGFDEALLADDRGFIVEASIANILMHYRNRILMPPVGEAALEGITQRTVMEFLKEENIPVFFEPIDYSMAYTCDELLLMGTAAQIVYAESIDDRPVKHPAGPIYNLLKNKYNAVLNGEHPRSKEWMSFF